MKKNILITDRFSHEALLILQQSGLFDIHKSQSPSELSAEHLKTAHALLIRSRTKVDEKLLAAAPQLQLIITCTSGFDHIDLEATRKWGITVMHTPDAHIESACQLTWALVLSCCQQVQRAHKMVKSGLWDRNSIIGLELAHRNYGIVGLGRIGQRVAKIAQAFGMQVLAYDPYQDDELFTELKISRLSYEELLKTSDVVSFHVPKTLETQYMLKRSQFEYIHRGLILVNTSRGQVIHEADLCEALDHGWIKSAGLDVFEKEPLSRNSKLLQYEQVILTPHIGANTDEAFFKASSAAAEKCLRFFIDGSTLDTLPPKAAWYGATPFGLGE